MMISMLARPSIPALSTQATDSDAPRRIAWQTALMMLAFLPASLILLHLDVRHLNGISVWVKPIKFEWSLALHFATLAWLVGLVNPLALTRRTMQVIFLSTACAGLFEMGYIALQAARGRASHFNDATFTEMVLYQLMGIGAVWLIVGAIYLGIRILKEPRAGLAPGLRLGAGLGLILGAAATLITAGILGSGRIPEALGYPVGHWIGGDMSDASGLPLFGWSTTGGDLRVPHFFATHIMQVLPVMGWLADRLMRERARLAVWLTAGVALAVVVGTLIQAVSGQPFLRY